MSSYPGPEALYDYELFAVINHEGQIDRGHYTSFARFQDTVRVPPSSLPATTDSIFLSQWCRFDDDKVTPASLSSVLGASAPIYMAFYVKRRLDYKPHTTPSYALARENAVVREREAQVQAQQAAKAREREREREVEDELLATVG